MPFVLKKHYDEMNHALAVYQILQGEFTRHDEVVKKHEGTFQARNLNSNFKELKQKRDLLESILKMAFTPMYTQRNES